MVDNIQNNEKKDEPVINQTPSEQPTGIISEIKEIVKFETENFSRHPIKKKRIKSSLLHFNFFYKITLLRYKLLVVIAIGIITGFLAVVMVENTGLYTGGTSAFFQGIARIVYVSLQKNFSNNKGQNQFIFNVLYWFMYLLLNIVLAIFAWKKIGREFTILSATYIFAVQIFGFIIGSIFNANNIHMNILGVTDTIDDNLNNFGVKCIYFNPIYFPGMNSTTNTIDWSVLYSETELHAKFPQYANSIISDIRNENLIKTYALLLYAVVYSIISSMFYSVLYIMGGSTAGSDFYNMYLNKAKGKSVGKLYTYMNGAFMILGVTIGSFSSAILIDSKHYFNINTLLSGNLICSIIWVVLSGTLIDFFYPKEKSVEVVVYTDKIDSILTHLQASNYPHAISNNIVYSLNNTTHNRLITTCFYFELSKLINIVRKYDKTCMIISKIIRDIDGEVDVEEGVG